MRLVALLIDYIAVTVIVVVISFLVGLDATDELGFTAYELGQLTASVFYLRLLLSPILVGMCGTTIGKRTLNLYVVRSDGGRCGFWRALGRFFGEILSILLVGIGYLVVAFREDKRGLHDLIAGTAVIRRYE